MSLLGEMHTRHVHRRRVDKLAIGIERMLPREVSSVLDVGCGDGRLTRMVGERRPGLVLQGIDPLVRPDALIPVHKGDGGALPVADRSFDAVLLIDVLHHTIAPSAVLREASRVARRCVIVKDHYRRGFAAAATLRFMDEIGNRRHGVALPYNYLDESEWAAALQESGLRREESDPMRDLYPWPASLVFGRGLHFLARLAPETPASSQA